MVLTPEDVDKLARGEMQRRGQPFPKLTKSELEVFERAKERGYIVHREGNAALANVWQSWCAATEQPHVTVRVRRRYACVEFELRDESVQLTEDGVQAAIQAMQRASTRIKYSHGPTSASHDEVPIENAEALAAEFLRIAREHVTSSSRPPR